MTSPIETRTAPGRFSTDDVPTKDRLSVLREVIGRTHLRFDIEAITDAPIRAVFEQHIWSSSSLFFGETTPLSFTRNRELICDGNADFRVVCPLSPCHQFVSGDTVDEINPGSAALAFCGAVGTIQNFNTCRIMSVRVRHDQLAAALPRLEERAFHAIGPGSLPLKLLADYMHILRRAGPSEDPVLAARVGQHLVDLVALAVEPTPAVRERTGANAVREARLAAIKADVLANLRQVPLSARTVGQRHNLSDRYVHVLFEQTGQTFSRFVEEERLKRAFALLTNPDRAGMRISDIAAEVGYVEHSSFSRAFRRRFGDTPKGVRHGRRTDQLG
jgi:AraC-like DNA-binding protein